MKKLIIVCGIMLLTIGSFSGCVLNRTSDSGDIAAFEPPAKPANVTSQSSNTTVRLNPTNQQLQIGETVVVDVVIQNVNSLFAADLNMQFNPAVLQVQDTDLDREGIQINPGGFPAPDFMAQNVVTNTTGTILYAITQVNSTQPVTGTGILASITFQAVGEGASDITFGTQLVNAQAQLIPVINENGQLTVVGQTSATATAPSAETPTMTPVVPITSTPMPTPTVAISATPTLTETTPTATPTVTPTPTQTPVPLDTTLPPGATVGACYRVKSSTETLESIAALPEHQTDAATLQRVNLLYPPGHIYLHQVLFVPTKGTVGNGPQVIEAEPNDTLSHIAKKCNLPLDFVEWANPNISVDDRLQWGHIVIALRPPFPPPSAYPHPRAGPFGPPSVSPPTTYGTIPWQPAPNKPSPGGQCDYVIQHGDTLYSIAGWYGVSVSALLQANGIVNADQIYAGQCLTIPGW